MFRVNSLSVNVDNKKILDDFNLDIDDGTIHVIMGRNGIGKSTLCKVIMHDNNYNVLNGNIIYNNVNLLDKETYEIAKLGVFLVGQNPISVDGITNAEMLRCALHEKTNKNVNIFEFNKDLEKACDDVKLDKSFIHKDINAGASGGEKKKIELLHAAMLKPTFLMLDELDSGLDVDSLKDVCNFINKYHEETKCSILIITHHPNIIKYIKPNYVHILSDGKIVKTGDSSLVYEIENEGYSYELNK